MRQVAKGMIPLVLLAGVVINCGTDLKLGQRPLFARGANVLQVYVVDGLNGEVITNATVNVLVGRHVLESELEGTQYTVYNIPQGTFPVTASLSGYLPFEGLYYFSNNNVTSTQLYTYEFGQIVMYPQGTAVADATVRAYDGSDGSPIAGADVIATLDRLAAVDSLVDDELTNVIAPTNGVLPIHIATKTDANGAAVLPKGQLVLGGTYDVGVFNGQNAAGQFLVTTEGVSFKVGTDFTDVTVFLNLPPETPVAITANNTEGLLHDHFVVTFPYAVEICSDPADHGWYDPNGTNRDLDANEIIPMDPPDQVTATLSAADTVLTLTANIDPANDDADDELTAYFTGVQVRVKGASTCTTLTSIEIRDTGSYLNPRIDIR